MSAGCRLPILLLIFCDAFAPSLSAQFQIFRGNSDNYTVESVDREEDLEYPGSNSRILNMIKKKWKNYYDCLMLRENMEKKPEMRRLLEGQHTEFICDYCPRPFQDYGELEWKYKPLSPDSDVREVEYLDLTPEMTLTPEKTLRIFNAIESLAGLYACYHRSDVVSVYVLEVSKNDTTERVETVRFPGESFLKLNQTEFEVSYHWTGWTECSACGRVGRKYKYGTCYLSAKQERVNSTRSKRRKDGYEKSVSVNESDESSYKSHEYLRNNFFEKLKNKIKNINATWNDTNYQTWGPEVLGKLSTGIPCASQYSPNSASYILDRLKAVKVLVKYCAEPCPGDEIFQVFDNLGNLIEWANNSAGVYSVFQKIPPLPPDIERRSIAADFGSDLIIQCPGLGLVRCVVCVSRTSLRNIPITWKVKKKIIFPEVVANESNGRFTIDLLHRIHLKRLRLKDSQIFSCWQREKLVGTVHLNVEKKLKIGFDHHVTLFGILAITGTFLFVGSKIITRELRKRKK